MIQSTTSSSTTTTMSLVLLLLLFGCITCLLPHGGRGAAVMHPLLAHEPSKKLQGLCAAVVHPSGYPCVEYTVSTHDGYALRLQRIPYGPSSSSISSPRPPIFLLHGVFQAGEVWVANPPEQSLGFILADAGFDVWIGNVRGTRWSDGHVSIPTQSKDFWNWSWDELAANDFPTMAELVYNITKSQIFFVGHSQGTLLSLTALGEAKVSKMIAAVVLLAPVGFLSNVRSPLALVAIHLQADRLLNLAGIPQVDIWSESNLKIFNQICDFDDTICRNIVTSITGPNCCFNESRMPFYFSFEPSPSSTKNVEHYFQMVRKGTCSKYDYGRFGNLVHYGSLTAPECDFSRVPKDLPMFIAYGGQDTLANVPDVHMLLGKLPGNPHVLYLENYAHLDFIFGTNAKADLYDRIVEFFRLQMRK